MRVLVTGAAGVLGSHVCRALADDERVEHLVGIDMVASHRYFPELADTVPLYPADVRDTAALLDLLLAERITHVVHMAAVLGRWYDTHPRISYEVNLFGTTSFMQAAADAGVRRFVFASSKSVYGEVDGGEHGPPDYRRLDEDDINPERPYALAKTIAESTGQMIARRTGMSLVALRFSDFYCPERLVKGSVRQAEYVNRLIVAAYCGAEVDLGAAADAAIDPMSIRDLARAVVAAVRADDPGHPAYNVATGDDVRVRAFVNALTAFFPGFTAHLTDGYEFGSRGGQVILDATRLLGDLEFRPAYPIEEGLADFVARLQVLTARGIVPDPRTVEVPSHWTGGGFS